VRDVLDVIQSVKGGPRAKVRADSEGEIVGGDIVEYNPTRDANGVTAFVAAKILKEVVAKALKIKE
jgi:arginase family enzyme